MIGGESFTIALRGILANKLRSALTMLGILIGVGSVIILVAVGNGSSKAVQNRIGWHPEPTLESAPARGAVSLAAGWAALTPEEHVPAAQRPPEDPAAWSAGS